MGLVIPIFRGDPIFKSVAWFFVKNLKFIFTLISEIKIHEKNYLTPKKFIFERRFSVPSDNLDNMPDSLGVN